MESILIASPMMVIFHFPNILFFFLKVFLDSFEENLTLSFVKLCKKSVCFGVMSFSNQLLFQCHFPVCLALERKSLVLCISSLHLLNITHM